MTDNEISVSEECARLLDEGNEFMIELELGFRMLERDTVRIIAAVEQEQQSASVALKAARAAGPPERSAARPVGDEDLLTLKEAICLPEFGGYLAIDPAYHRPSATFTKKVLEGYIAKGLPIVQKRKGETIRVKPKSIREFFSECQDQPSRPTSSGSDRAITKQVNLPGKASGQSGTDRSSLARDSALSMLTKLRKG